MKREFLQNFKVDGTPLPKEIVDAILDENSRDIGAAKSAYADYDTLKNRLAEAQKTIQGFREQGQDMESVRQSAQAWEEKYNQAISDHRKQMEDIAFETALKDAVAAARGRSVKAIRAMLDEPALRESKNREADMKAALEGLKKESGYLFESDQTPPPFASGTGTSAPGKYDPETAAIRSAAGLKND